jgi:hypothetical protein
MFSFRSKETPQLQLYGKLPLAKDYLRIGCGDGVARRLREWMDRGFSPAGEGAQAPMLPGATAFILRDRSGTAVLGILWPSSDAGGLRPFPFALLVERKWKVLAREIDAGLGECDRWFAALEAIWGRLGTLAEGAEVLSALRGLSVEPLGDAQAQRDIPFDPWLAHLGPSGATTLDGILSVLVRARGERLTLPLAPGFTTTSQVHAWWSALSQVGRVLEKSELGLFFPRDTSNPGQLVVVLGTPDETTASDLARRTPPAGRPTVIAASHSEAGPTLAKSLCDAMDRIRSQGGPPPSA